MQWLAAHGEGISLDIIKPYPKINEMMERLLDLPAIKAYYAK